VIQSQPVLATALLSLSLLANAPAPAPIPPRLPDPGFDAAAPEENWAEPSSEALTQQLAAALLAHTDAEQDALLRSLRRLRDPGLRALFARIAAADRAVLRVHGVLGLAELESPPRVDLLLVKRMPDPREQLIVIGEALRAGMLPTDQLEDIVRWPGLDPALVVLVMGRLQRAGVNVDPAALDAFIRADHREAAIYAALERGERASDTVGGAAAAIAVLEGVLALPRTDPDAAATIGDILRYIREERLARSAWFAQRILADASGARPGEPPDDGESDSLKFEALRTLLVVAPADPATLEAFRARFESGDAAARRGLALAVLEATVEQPLLPPYLAGPPAPALPPALFDLLRAGGDPSLRAMADAGEAAMLGATPAPPAAPDRIAALLAHEPDPATLGWALLAAGRLDAPAASQVRLAVLNSVLGVHRHRDDLRPAAAAAAAALAESDPDALLAPLAAALAERDILAQNIVLAGALRAANPDAARLAAPPVPLRPLDDSPLVESMAALLRTRRGTSISEADFRTLARTAVGEVADAQDFVMPAALRVQAAWLALRARGQQRIALARVLAAAESAEPSGADGTH